MSLTLAADGPLLIILDAAKRMLTATAEWTAIASAARIHYDALPPPTPGPHYTLAQMVAARPFALLWHDLSGGYRIESGASTPSCPNQSGKVICQIELNVPTEHTTNPTTLATWANGVIGRLVRTGNPASPGLWDLSRQSTYLPITSIEVDAYERTTVQESRDLGDAIIFELALTWSTR